MKEFFIIALFAMILLNVITLIYLIKRRKKDKQNDTDISMLQKSIVLHENSIKKIEEKENKVKESFKNALIHTNNVANELNQVNAHLSQEIKNLNYTIYEKRNELLKTIEEKENKTKDSFKNALDHTNSVNEALKIAKNELSHKINDVCILLQELKEENFNKSQEHKKAINELDEKIKNLLSNYKELKWQIENITAIEEDSKLLNADIDGFQQDDFIKIEKKEPTVAPIINEKVKVEEKDSSAQIYIDDSSIKKEEYQGNVEPAELPISKEKVDDDVKSAESPITKEDGEASKKPIDLPFVEEPDDGTKLEDLPNIEEKTEESLNVFENVNPFIDSKAEEFAEPPKVQAKIYDSLDEEQSRAFDYIENTNGNYFITGKAGTGKSYLLRYFQSHTKKSILKLAPTGIAALNIGGATIHSAFGFGNLNQDLETLSKNTIRLSSEKSLVLKNMDVLIIDEISMVRSDIFDKIDKILKIICQKEDLPFGGKQVLVFGDLFQLPPIANKEEEKYLMEKYGGVFFFKSNSYKNSNFSFIELKTNHRQKGDQKFFEILNKIREGSMTNADIDLVNQRYVEDDESLRRIIRLYPKKEYVNSVNNNELNKILGNEQVYEAKITYQKYRDIGNPIENNFQLSESLRLKVGAMVMMTRNDPGHRWVNGTLGIVSRLEKDSIFVHINGIPYEIGRTEFEQCEAIYENRRIVYHPVLRVSQFPMILAYAITIHKSQGSTYQRIACDPTDCFAPGQAYVALSRCVDLNGVHLLKKLNSTAVKVNSQVREFYLSNTR